MSTREGSVAELDPGLLELLTFWVPQQPWYTGTPDGPVAVRVLARTQLRAEAPRVEHLVLAVEQDVGVEVYQVPVSVRWEAEHRMEHVRIGQLRDGDDHRGWAYDALHDKDAMDDLLRHVAGSDTVGSLVFVREGEVELPLGEPSTVLTHQHANTSLAYGDSALLKAFRRLQPGTNPDLEVHRALTHHGNTHVAPLFGAVTGTWSDPHTSEPREGSLAMVKRFLVTATDGCQMAEASVRDLFAEGDLHPHEVGGDFRGEALRLGNAVAAVHADMRATLVTGTLGAADLRAAAAGMRARLEEALPVVEGLDALAPALGEAYDAVAAHPGPVAAQRVHGDLRLDNALRTVVGWKLIDFEGDSDEPIEARTRLDSPLCDVAAMRRSIDAVAQRLRLADHPNDPQIAYRATEWAERNADAFVEGWVDGMRAAGADDALDERLLRAYELDQTVVAALDEARHRPTRVAIPLALLERAVG